MSDHLQLAGQLAVDAHADWATASASVHSSEAVLDSIRARGNKSWDEALHNLRLYGIKHDEDEFSSLNTDKDGAFINQSYLSEDFEPLNQMHRRNILSKIFSRLAIVTLIAFSSFAVGSLYGFNMGQDTPKITVEQLAAQLHQLDELAELEKQKTPK